MKKQALSSVIGNFIESRKANYSSPFHKGDGFFTFSGNEASKWDIALPADATEALTFIQSSVANSMGAAHAFFTTCGARTALLSMLQCFSAEGTLLLLRSCNGSALGAAINCHADTIVVQASASSPFPEESQLECLIAQYHAKAVLVTSPDIYGRSADLPTLAKAAHRQNALLLVDGSLGASIPYEYAAGHNPYAFADIWYHDLSFSLRGMVQCGCVFLNPCSVSADQLQHHLDCLLPEAPSALLLTAADWAIYMGQHTDWNSFFTRCSSLCHALSGIPGISIRSKEQGAYSILCIDVSGRGITGFEAGQRLIRDGLSIQFSDGKHIVLLLSPCDDPAWDKLAIEKISRLPINTRFIDIPAIGQDCGNTVTIPSGRNILRRPLNECIGKISAEPLTLGTHGPVLLVPGEIISQETISYLLYLSAQGANINGIRNGTIALLAEETV